MNDRNSSNAGCALIVIALLIALTIAVIILAPWVLIAVPLVIVSVVVSLILLADVTSDDVLVNSEEQGGYDAWRIRMLNPLRRFFTKPMLIQVPKMRVAYEERQMVKQAVKITVAIADTLKKQSVLGADRAQVQVRAEEVPFNMAKALWRLDRLRRMKRTVDDRLQDGISNQLDYVAMERQIMAQIQQSLDSLTVISVNLLKVEMQQASRPVERLLSELNETNQHLRDIDDTLSDLRATQTKR